MLAGIAGAAEAPPVRPERPPAQPPCQLPGGDEIMEHWRRRPDAPIHTLKPGSNPDPQPLLAMGGDCGDGRPQVVLVKVPKGPYECWSFEVLGCADVVMERPIRDLGTIVLDPPVEGPDGVRVVAVSAKTSLLAIEVTNEAGCTDGMLCVALDVKTAWQNLVAGTSGVDSTTFLSVAGGSSKWPNSPTGMPTPNEWLACVCLEIDASGLSDPVKFQLKSAIQACLANHLTCLQETRTKYLEGLTACESDGGLLGGLGIGAGAGAAIGGAILMCVTAPVSVPLALGLVGGGLVVGAVVGGGTGELYDRDQEGECVLKLRKLHLDRLKRCDDAVKNCLKGNFNAAGFQPACPPLWPGIGNFEPIWSPPGWEWDPAPGTCPPIDDPDVRWPEFPKTGLHDGTPP